MPQSLVLAIGLLFLPRLSMDASTAPPLALGAGWLAAAFYALPIYPRRAATALVRAGLLAAPAQAAGLSAKQIKEISDLASASSDSCPRREDKIESVHNIRQMSMRISTVLVLVSLTAFVAPAFS